MHTEVSYGYKNIVWLQVYFMVTIVYYGYKYILWIKKNLMDTKVSQRHPIHQQVAVQKNLMNTKVSYEYKTIL